MATRVTQAGEESNQVPQTFYESAAPILDPIANASLGLFGVVPFISGLAEGVRSGVSGEGFGAGWSRGAGEAGAAALDPFVRTTEDAARFFGGKNARAPWEVPSTGGAPAASKTGYLETLLGGTPTFNREQYLSEQDPRLMAQLAAYDRMMTALRPEVEKAKSAVSGAYGAAAGAGRTAAGNIGTRGERTAATFEDLYGRAATEAGDMAQAGGTMVSGLTGPGQAFQDIYGGAYGLGGTEAYGTRGEAGLAAEGMRAQAQQAAGAGSRASSNIQNYWDRMTARERFAFDSALADAQFQRGETLKLKEDQLSLSTGNLVGMYRDNKDMRKSLKKQFGSVTDQNYNTEIPRLLNQLSATYGPEAVLRTLQESGLAFGATGG